MMKREELLLSNALDALDRLYDGDSSVIDVQALLLATGEALRGTVHFPHLEGPATELLAVTRSSETREAKRDRALGITDELRHYLAQHTPGP
jgi:hypothetical protein